MADTLIRFSFKKAYFPGEWVGINVRTVLSLRPVFIGIKSYRYRNELCRRWGNRSLLRRWMLIGLISCYCYCIWGGMGWLRGEWLMHWSGTKDSENVPPDAVRMTTTSWNAICGSEPFQNWIWIETFDHLTHCWPSWSVFPPSPQSKQQLITAFMSGQSVKTIILIENPHRTMVKCCHRRKNSRK